MACPAGVTKLPGTLCSSCAQAVRDGVLTLCSVDTGRWRVKAPHGALTRPRRMSTGRQSGRQEYRQTDRPTVRQRGRQTDRPTGKHAGRQTDRPTGRGRPTDGATDRPTGRQTDGATDQQTDTQLYRQADRQADRQFDREADIPTDRQAGARLVPREGEVSCCALLCRGASAMRCHAGYAVLRCGNARHAYTGETQGAQVAPLIATNCLEFGPRSDELPLESSSSSPLRGTGAQTDIQTYAQGCRQNGAACGHFGSSIFQTGLRRLPPPRSCSSASAQHVRVLRR